MVFQYARIPVASLALVVLLGACVSPPADRKEAAGTAPAIQVESGAPSPSSPETTSAPTFTPPARLIPVLYDDDGSPDGTAALFYLLSHPEVSVEAIGISYGEAYPASYIQHIGRALDSLGIQGIPLGAGQDGPLAGDNEFPEWLREAAEGFWGLPRPNAEKTYPAQSAPELFVSVIESSPEPVTVFISGPSTNLAQALRLEPGIREKIAAVFIMGGAVYAPGNIDDLLPATENRVAEWNVYADPQAAREVLESGLRIFLVPLDATNLVTITREDTGQWRLGGGSAGFAAEIYDMMLDTWAGDRAPSWDLMTAAILARPDLCAFRPLNLEIDTSAREASGQTVVVAEGGSTVQVCLEPDVGRIKRELEAIFSGQR